MKAGVVEVDVPKADGATDAGLLDWPKADGDDVPNAEEAREAGFPGFPKADGVVDVPKAEGAGEADLSV